MYEFKLIVAGGRDFVDAYLLSQEINKLSFTTYADKEVSIVSGMARGADSLAHRFAKTNGIVVYEMPADWGTHGKRAGFMRNERMAHFSDGLLAFWDGYSKGTAHMIDYMRSINKPTHVVRY